MDNVKLFEPTDMVIYVIRYSSGRIRVCVNPGLPVMLSILAESVSHAGMSFEELGSALRAVCQNMVKADIRAGRIRDI